MTRKQDIQKLLIDHTKRLQKLKETQARMGIDTPPHILTEIDEIEAEIGQLQTELDDIVGLGSQITALIEQLERKDYQEARKYQLPHAGPSSRKDTGIKLLKSVPLSIIVFLLFVGSGIGFFTAEAFNPPPRPTPIPTITPVPSPTSAFNFIQSFPSVSFVNISYSINDFDPHRIDLRTVSSSGIPVEPGQGLQFLDIWVSVSEDAPGYGIEAQVFVANTNQYIGKSDFIPVRAGIFQLGDVAITAFNHGDYPAAWKVRDDWTDLIVEIATYTPEKERIVLNRMEVHFDKNGKAWFTDPPNLGFASLVYAINDGFPLVLDLRDAAKVGLGAKPGDTLSLLEIWYNSNAYDEDTTTIHVEAYLGSAFNEGTFKETQSDFVRKGIQKLSDVSHLTWTIPENEDFLTLTLVRNEQSVKAMVMDRLKLPLNAQEDRSLIPSSQAVRWPFDQVEYIDFESPADQDKWAATEISTIARSTKRAFTGDYALAITTTGTTETPEGKIFAFWQHPFQAEGLVMQVYWPRQEGVKVIWPQLCLTETGICNSIPADLDQWNTFILNLAQEKSDDEQTLNTLTVPALYLQGEVEGVDEAKPYTFYIDAVQLYPANDQ